MSICHFTGLPSTPYAILCHLVGKEYYIFHWGSQRQELLLLSLYPQKARGLMWLKFWKFNISSQDPESWASGTNMKGWFKKQSYLLGAYCPCLCLPWFLTLFNPGLSASSVSSQFPSNNFPFHLGQSQSDSVTWNQKSSLIWGSGQDSEL